MCLATLVIGCDDSQSPSENPVRLEPSPPRVPVRSALAHDEEHRLLERQGKSEPGRLGFPLGTSVRIAGVRKTGFKVGNYTLAVDSVNGEPLATPVAVRVDDLGRAGLPPAIRCVFEGYETGRVIGCKSPHQQAAHQFYRVFIVTEVVEPSSVEVFTRAPNPGMERAHGR